MYIHNFKIKLMRSFSFKDNITSDVNYYMKKITKSNTRLIIVHPNITKSFVISSVFEMTEIVFRENTSLEVLSYLLLV